MASLQHKISQHKITLFSVKNHTNRQVQHRVPSPLCEHKLIVLYKLCFVRQAGSTFTGAVRVKHMSSRGHEVLVSFTWFHHSYQGP